MTLREAILKGDVRALGRYADRMRAIGAKYQDVYENVRKIYEDAGRTPPELAEFDEMLRECDDAEARERA